MNKTEERERMNPAERSNPEIESPEQREWNRASQSNMNDQGHKIQIK